LKGGAEMENISINELAMRTMEALQVLGLAIHTVWTEYCDAMLPIVKLHEKQGKTSLDHDTMNKYMRHIEERCERGEIGSGHYNRLRRGAERLIEMNDIGRLEWSCPSKVSKFKLNAYFEGILSEFLSQKQWNPNTCGDVTWVARKFFAWLIFDGHKDLAGVGADEIQRFMIHCSNHMRSTGVHNVKIYMKKLCRYLYESGRITDSYEVLLSFRVSRESRLLPAAPDEEIAAVLNIIDRRTPKGKRDYAIILLGAVIGLRAIDIVRLKLSDIDWQNGEIKIVQSKTGKSLALPLTKDVGEAIQDYILNGRQATASKEIFLRHHAPYQAFADGMAVEYMYDTYRKKSGLPREAFDGKGFHSLRRSVGRNMATSGTPITTVAQVLGDSNINSTNKYISLDSRHLKECALDLTGIEPEVTQ